MNRREFLKLAAVPVAAVIPAAVLPGWIDVRESSGAYEFFSGGTYLGSMDVENSAGPVMLMSGSLGRYENIRFIHYG